MEKKKIKLGTPPPLLNPEIARAKQIAQAEQERLEKIVKRIINILIEENVKIREVTRILNMVDAEIGKEIGDKLVDEIHNVQKEEKQKTVKE